MDAGDWVEGGGGEEVPCLREEALRKKEEEKQEEAPRLRVLRVFVFSCFRVAYISHAHFAYKNFCSSLSEVVLLGGFLKQGLKRWFNQMSSQTG